MEGGGGGDTTPVATNKGCWMRSVRVRRLETFLSSRLITIDSHWTYSSLFPPTADSDDEVGVAHQLVGNLLGADDMIDSRSSDVLPPTNGRNPVEATKSVTPKLHTSAAMPHTEPPPSHNSGATKAGVPVIAPPDTTIGTALVVLDSLTPKSTMTALLVLLSIKMLSGFTSR